MQRKDELRGVLLARFGSDALADAELQRLQRLWTVQMNICYGKHRIVKVLPMKKNPGYPDSKFRDIPQWELLKTRPKKFKWLFSH